MLPQAESPGDTSWSQTLRSSVDASIKDMMPVFQQYVTMGYI